VRPALPGGGRGHAEDIDLVVKAGYGFRLPVLGPWRRATSGAWILSTEFLRIYSDLSAAQTPPPLLKRLTEEGKLGVKTGEGIYKYPPAVARRKIKSETAACSRC